MDVLTLSFTKSKMLPHLRLVGDRSPSISACGPTSRWHTAVENLVRSSPCSVLVLVCIIIGILLAILLDQKIRTEGVSLRTVYLYPMALSFIVTGTAWKWMLNPTLGIQKVMRDMGIRPISPSTGWSTGTCRSTRSSSPASGNRRGS